MAEVRRDADFHNRLFEVLWNTPSPALPTPVGLLGVISWRLSVKVGDLIVYRNPNPKRQHLELPAIVVMVEHLIPRGCEELPHLLSTL